ncbi:MFS transporter [Streptomyces seoulensis]
MTTSTSTSPSSSSWRMVRVLRDRDAGLYLAGVVVSGFGSSALWLASGVWVKDLTGSSGLAALCLLALWAPTPAGPLLGAIADRVRRKPLLIGGNLLLGVLVPVLVTVDSPGRVWLIYTVLFLYGAVGVVHDAAESALVATVVDRSLLGDFNGLRVTVNEGMKLVAPLAGAGLYAVYGGPSVAVLDAVTFVLAAGVCALLRVREDEPARSVGGWRERTAEGARFLWGCPRLRPLVLAGGTMMLCAGVAGALLHAVIDGLGRPPAYAGVLYAVQGAGSMAVGLLSGPALGLLGERRFAAAGIALTACAAAARAVPSDAVVLAAGAASGVGMPCVLIAAMTAVQQQTPDALLGRTAATAGTLLFTPNVLGLAAGAALLEAVDYRLLLTCLAAVLLATATTLVCRRTQPLPARAVRS